MKYEYTYKEVECELEALHITFGHNMSFGSISEIIDRYAEQGWRYAGWVPCSVKTTGWLEKIQLVFEREKEEENI